MKYFIADIDERHGEFECRISVVFSTEGDPHEKHEDIVKTWYDIDLQEDADNEGWYWNAEMCYSAGNITEIDKACFDQSRGHLTDMS
jgi:hypothetical protein